MRQGRGSALARMAGKDVFISYARRDGAGYALKLASDLTGRGFACVIDQWGSEPGQRTPESIRRDLQRCQALVIVGTVSAAISEHVEDEIRAFVATRGIIVPVDLQGCVPSARWFPLIEGLPIAQEPRATDGGVAQEPSDAIVGRVVNALTFRRRDQRLRRLSYAVGGVLAVLLAASGGAAYMLQEQVRKGELLQGQLRIGQKNLAIADAGARAAAQRAGAAQRQVEAAETRTREERARAAAARRLADAANAQVKRQLALIEARQRLSKSAFTVNAQGDRDDWAPGFRQALRDAQRAARDLSAGLPRLTQADEAYVRDILVGLPRVQRTPYKKSETGFVSDDGRRLLVKFEASDDYEVHDRASHKLITTVPEGALRTGDFDHQLRVFFWGDDEREITLDVDGKVTHLTIPGDRDVAPMAVNSRGDQLLYVRDEAKDDPTQLVLRDLRTSAETVLCRAGDGPAAFSPDDRWLLTFCEAAPTLWDAASGKRVAKLEPLGDSNVDIAFSRDGKRVAYASVRWVAAWTLGDKPASLGSHQFVDEDEDDDFISAIGLDRTGEGIAINYDDEAITCYAVPSWAEIGPKIASYEWTERGRYEPSRLAKTTAVRMPADDGISLIDTCGNRRLVRVALASDSKGAIFNEVRRELAVVNEHGDLYIVDAAPLTANRETVLEGEVRAYAAAAAAPVHATITANRLLVWDAQADAELLNVATAFTAIGLSEDGRVLAAASKDSLHVWRCLGQAACDGWREKVVPLPVKAGDFGPSVKVTAQHVAVYATDQLWVGHVGRDGLTQTRLPVGGALQGLTSTLGGSRLIYRDADRATLFTAELRGAALVAPRRVEAGWSLAKLRVAVLAADSWALAYDGTEADKVDRKAAAPLRRAMVIDLKPGGTPRSIDLTARHSPTFAVSGDGRHLAVVEDPTYSVPEASGPEIVEIIDVRTGQVTRRELPTHVIELGFGPTGELFAAAAARGPKDPGFALWVLDPNGWRATVRGYTSSRADALAFGRDGALGVGQLDGRLVVLDRDGAETLSAPQRGRVVNAAFAPDGRRVYLVASTPDTTTFQVVPASRAELVRRLVEEASAAVP